MCGQELLELLKMNAEKKFLESITVAVSYRRVFTVP